MTVYSEHIHDMAKKFGLQGPLQILSKFDVVAFDKNSEFRDMAIFLEQADVEHEHNGATIIWTPALSEPIRSVLSKRKGSKTAP